MKAQSAIEYLITYGWALIALSAVTGAVYPMINEQCADNATGFLGDVIEVDSFAVSNQELLIEIENTETEIVEINRIEVDDGESFRVLNPNNEFLGPREEDLVDILGVESGETCNDIEITITFDVGPLENQVSTGEIQSNLEIIDADSPQPVLNFGVEAE